MRIPLGQLRLRPHALRYVDRTSEDYIQLRDAIRSTGVVESFVVRRVGDEQYEILSGQNRFDIIKCLGWKDVDCQVVDCDDDMADQIEIAFNANKIEPTPQEYARKLLDIVRRRPDVTDDQLRLIVHKNPEWIHRHLDLEKLADSLREAVFDGAITIKNGLSLAKLKRSQQKKLETEARTMGVEDFRRLVMTKLHTDIESRRKRPERDKVFIEPRLRKFKQLLAVHEDPAKFYMDGLDRFTIQKVMEWVFSMDPETLATRTELKKRRLETKVKRYENWSKE